MAKGRKRKKREKQAVAFGDMRMAGGNVAVPSAYLFIAPIEEIAPLDSEHGPEEAARLLLEEREVQAVDELICDVYVAIDKVRAIFKEFKRPVDSEQALSLIRNHVGGIDDADISKLVAAAFLHTVVIELLPALPKHQIRFMPEGPEIWIARVDGSDAPDAIATWRTAYLAHQLAFWLGKLAAHGEVHKTRSTGPATKQRVKDRTERIAKLRAALKSGAVKRTDGPEAVRLWYLKQNPIITVSADTAGKDKTAAL